MNTISNQLTNWLVRTQVITEEERELYQYGIFQIVVNMLDIFSIFLIAMLFHKVWATFFYTICFCILRKYAGGYHAKSVGGCYLMTVGFTTIMLLIIRYYKFSLIGIVVIWFLSGISIFLLVPVQNRNKELDEVEQQVYRKRAIKVWVFESILMWILYSFGFLETAEGILLSNVFILISMMAELKYLLMLATKSKQLCK